MTGLAVLGLVGVAVLGLVGLGVVVLEPVVAAGGERREMANCLEEKLATVVAE